MNLQLEELRSFVVLARELHFGRASRRLFISQPALSKQIQKIEQKVGGPLFARTNRKVILTSAAQVLLPLALSLLSGSETALQRTREAVQGRAGTLRIGFGIASASQILPRTILRFRRAYPQVELQMRDMSTPSQVAALLSATIDVGILRMPVEHRELHSFPLFRERLVAVVPRSVQYDSRSGLVSLRDRSFIQLPKTTSITLHEHLARVFNRAGFTPRIVQEANELFTILNLVRAGIGVSLVPSAAMRMKVPGVKFHELRMSEAEWSIGVAWAPDSEKRALISRFTDALRLVVRETLPQPARAAG